MTDHGHSQKEIVARINAPPGRGVLRDVVYGGIDGSVTTFAIVAGVAGAGLSPFIIVALGLANVLADGFSMAAGNYSGTKAELDNIRQSGLSKNVISTFIPTVSAAKCARFWRRRACQAAFSTRRLMRSRPTTKTGST